MKIIGVVRDYNIESLHKTIAPVTLELSETNDAQYISVRLSNSRDVFQTLESVEDTWRKHTGYKPLQYFFLDTEFQKLYQAESNTGRILLLFAAMAIFIACMGLVGLMTYLTNLRQKEIGIRKVLGAGASAIVKLLSVNVVKLLGIAVLVSWPLAYYFTRYWLNNFADRIFINPIIYLVAPFIVLIFIILAVFVQTARAVSANPVDSLRDE